MCKSSDTIAHDLFYPQDAQRERQSPKGRFSIHRGHDFTVAYSYTTPIAVYPDDGDFVLLDAKRFSNTTSGHQLSVRRAVPYNVRCVECDWLGINDIWKNPRYDDFHVQFKRFVRDIGQRITTIGKSDGDYAYSRERNETLERLKGLCRLAEVSHMKQTLISKLEKRIAAVTDAKRIQRAQRRVFKQREAEKKQLEKNRQATQLRSTLYRLFLTNDTVQRAVTNAAEQMLQRFPYHQWKWLPKALQEPKGEQAKQLMVYTQSAITKAAEGLWRDKYGKPVSIDDCDVRWCSDGLFRTTKGVAIAYAELQRCLGLWKSGWFLGEVVDNRFHVLRNDAEVLIIGCHCFRQETVQQIWERYAGKSPKTINYEENERKQQIIDYINQVMQPLLKLVRHEFRINQQQTIATS